MLDTCVQVMTRVPYGACGAGDWQFEDNSHSGCQSGLADQAGRGLDEGNSMRQGSIETCVGKRGAQDTEGEERGEVPSPQSKQINIRPFTMRPSIT